VVPEAEQQRLLRFKRHVAAHGKELGTPSQKHFSKNYYFYFHYYFLFSLCELGTPSQKHFSIVTLKKKRQRRKQRISL
jgi:hypothetical protein